MDDPTAMPRDGGAPTATIEDGMEGTPSASDDVSVDGGLIQNQLREKEQLVAALTERLEQAAEQLDRLRRTGVDKGRRPLGGGFPAEVIEDHKATLEDLKRVIARWEDIQAGASLGRIETQIAELRDLMAGSGSAGLFSSAPAAARPAASAAPAPPPPRAESTEITVPRAGGKSGSNAWWEAQKAALMGEPVAPEVQAALAAESANPIPPPEETTERAPSTGPLDLANLSIPDLPAPIDFENITLDDARTALRERDTVIQKLRESLLLIKASNDLPAGLRSLSDLPEPLKARISELEEQWQAKFRQVELDVSLERARLAREQAAVRQQQEALQKQSRKGAASLKAAADELSVKADKGEESASSKRRWFRFMGKGEESGEDSGQSDERK